MPPPSTEQLAEEIESIVDNEGPGGKTTKKIQELITKHTDKEVEKLKSNIDRELFMAEKKGYDRAVKDAEKIAEIKRISALSQEGK